MYGKKYYMKFQIYIFLKFLTYKLQSVQKLRAE